MSSIPTRSWLFCFLVLGPFFKLLYFSGFEFWFFWYLVFCIWSFWYYFLTWALQCGNDKRARDNKTSPGHLPRLSLLLVANNSRVTIDQWLIAEQFQHKNDHDDQFSEFFEKNMPGWSPLLYGKKYLMRLHVNGTPCKFTCSTPRNLAVKRNGPIIMRGIILFLDATNF